MLKNNSRKFSKSEDVVYYNMILFLFFFHSSQRYVLLMKLPNSINAQSLKNFRKILWRKNSTLHELFDRGRSMKNYHLFLFITNNGIIIFLYSFHSYFQYGYRDFRRCEGVSTSVSLQYTKRYFL